MTEQVEWFGKPIEEMDMRHLRNSLHLMRERCAAALRLNSLCMVDGPYPEQRQRTKAYFEAEIVDSDAKALLLEAEIKRRDDIMLDSRTKAAEQTQDRRSQRQREIDNHFDQREQGTGRR